MGKLKKIVIENSSFPYALLLGLVSNDSVFQLCYKINEALNIRLKSAEAFFLKNEPIPMQFSFYDEYDHIYALLKNQHNKTTLLKKEHSKLDYLFIVTGDFDIEEKEHIKQQVKLFVKPILTIELPESTVNHFDIRV